MKNREAQKRHVTYITKKIMFFCFWDGLGEEKTERRQRASFPEEGAASDAVQQVVRLSSRRLGQRKHLLLRHAGGDGDVALLKGWQVLVRWDRVGITDG